MAASGPTKIKFLSWFDLWSSVEVVSFSRGAVPPLANSLDFCLIFEGIGALDAENQAAELIFISQTTSYN